MTMVTWSHISNVKISMSGRDKHTPSVDDGGELEAQALAKRRGGLDKDIVALQGRAYDVPLEGSASCQSWVRWYGGNRKQRT